MNYNANQYLRSLKEYKWYRFDNIPDNITDSVIRIMDENSHFEINYIWDETGEYFTKVNKKETNYKINY